MESLVDLTKAESDHRFILDYARRFRHIHINAAVYIIAATEKLNIICLKQAHHMDIFFGVIISLRVYNHCHLA